MLSSPFFPSALCRTPSPQALACPAAAVRTLGTEAEPREGRPLGDGEVQTQCMSLEARLLRSLASRVRSDSGPRSSFLFFIVHLLPIHPTVPLTNHFLCFCWDFPSSLVCCSTKFGFSWAVLVSKANVQFWNCLASETDKLKITKEKSNFQEVFKTQNKLGSRCSLTYKRSPISVFVYVLNFIFTL